MKYSDPSLCVILGLVFSGLAVVGLTTVGVCCFGSDDVKTVTSPAGVVTVDSRMQRIVEKAIAHERWCRENAAYLAAGRTPADIDQDAVSLLEERLAAEAQAAKVRPVPPNDSVVFHLHDNDSTLVVSSPGFVGGKQLKALCLWLNSDPGIQERLQAYLADPQDPEPYLTHKNNRPLQYLEIQNWRERHGDDPLKRGPHDREPRRKIPTTEPRNLD